MNCNWGAVDNYTWGEVDDYTWGNLTICQKVKALSSSTAVSSSITRTTAKLHIANLSAVATTSRFIKSIKTATVKASVTVRRGTRKALQSVAHALSTVGRAIYRKKILTALSTALPTATRKTRRIVSATILITASVIKSIKKLVLATVTTIASRTAQSVQAIAETIYLTVVHSTTVALTAIKESTKSLTAIFNQTEQMTATTNEAVALTVIHSNVQEVTWTMGADPKGETIYMRLGETKTVELTVLTPAGAAADLTGATAKFRTENATADTACTISSNKITAEIAANAFAKAGSYGYEFRIKDALNKVDSLVFGTIKVADRLVSTF